MADDAVEQLLLRFGIDLSPLKQSYGDIKSMLTALNSLNDEVLAKSKAALAAQKVIGGELKNQQEALAVASKAQAKTDAERLAQEKVATEQGKQAAQQQQIAAKEAIELNRQAMAVSQQLLQSKKLEIAEEQRKTAELRRQITIAREEAAQQRREAQQGAGESGLLGRLTKGLAGGLFGGGLAGSVAGGVLAGGGIAMVLEGVVQGIERFTEKIREVVKESGKLVIVEDTFNRIARATGVNGTEMVEKMQVATTGLVDKLTLVKIASAGLSGNLKLNSEQIISAVGDIMKVAAAHGKDGAEALQRFNRMLETGTFHARMLGRMVGETIQPITTGMAGLDRYQRLAKEAGDALAQIHVRATAIGEIPETFERMIKRLQVSWHDLLDEFGKGFNTSAGMQGAYEVIKGMVSSIHSMEEGARKAGQMVGDAFSVLLIGGSSVVSIIKQLVTLFKDIFEAINGLLYPTSELKDKGDEVVGSFEKLHPVLFGVASGVLQINGLLEKTIIIVDEVVKQFKKLPEFIKENAPLFGALFGAAAGMEMGGGVGALIGAGAGLAAGVGYQGTGQQTTQTGGVEFRDGHPVLKGGAGARALTHGGSNAAISNDATAIVNAVLAGHQRMGELVEDAVPLDKRLAEVDKRNQDVLRNLALGASRTGEGADIAHSPEPALDPKIKEERLRAQDAYNAALLKAQKAHNELLYDTEKKHLDEMKELDDNAYKDGLEGIQEHLGKQLDIARAQNAATKIKLSQDYANAVAEFNQSVINKQQEKGPSGAGQDPEALKTQIAAMNKGFEATTEHYKQSMTDADDALTKQRVALKEQGIRDQRAADLERIQTTKQAEMEALEAQQKETEHRFGKGEIDPQAYLTQRLAIINQLKEAQIRAAEEVYAASVKNDKDRETRDRARELATQKAREEASGLGQQMPGAVMSYVQKTYQPQTQALESIYTQQQGIKTPESQQASEATLTHIIALLKQQQQELAKAAELAKSSGELETWYQILDKMEQVYQTQLKYNLALVEMRDIMNPITSTIEGLGKMVGQVFTSKYMQNLLGGIEAGAKLLQAGITAYDKSQSDSSIPRAGIVGLFDLITGGNKAKTSVVKSPAQLKMEEDTKAATATKELTNEFGNLQKAIQKFIAELGGKPTQGSDEGSEGPGEGGNADASYSTVSDGSSGGSSSGGSRAGGGSKAKPFLGSDKANATASAILSTADSIANFVSAIKGSQTTGSGAASGALSGASMGAAAGPIGMAVGAAVGATVGAIVGHKNQVVTEEINAANIQFKNIMDTFGQNSNNLSVTMNQLTQLIAQVTAEQASSKKGSAKFQTLIDQYTQQLISMQDQQIQIIRTMNEQIATLNSSTPLSPVVSTGMTQYLSQLQQILLQYQQFAGAAESAQDLANANNFLTQSLQNYEYNLENQLLQDNEQAINDAIQLNDLTYQRTQLVNQLNQQIEGVLAQGDVTRMATRAQTAGTQIEQIQVQAQMQLAQMNEEISLAQYKVAAEQQIFGLASTRIGLEAQLLQLQEVQASQQMQVIQALQAYVGSLGTGNPALNAIIASIPISAISPTAGTGGNAVNLTNFLEQLFSAAYSSYASMGYGSFAGQGL